MGRWNKKGTVEEHKRLDIRYLYRHDMLTPGFHSIGWSRWGESAGNITFQASELALTLIYRFRGYGQEWEDVRQDVPLDWTPCHFGGERPWFICGNCGRRVAVIYAGGKYFACRHCYDLTYTSCQESDSRFSRFLGNYGNFGGWENMPLWALKGLLSRSRREEERLEKEISRKRRGRPRKKKSGT
jgi:hypothetical protein